ncbi:MAG: triose-phosphate isomerase [marine benthic group bacterium]|nr:triose-phosphate isomerase [Gemmatimonadota bacterium]
MTVGESPLFAANWKMFKGPRATEAFVESFVSRYRPREDRRIAFFPPSISLEAFVRASADRPDLEVGIQDVHQEVEGAHTGAVSASMAVEAGAKWALAGHSERRREFGDDDAIVAVKTARALEAGLIPIVCIGETLEEREAGLLQPVLERQVREVLAAVPANGLTWAYEPVWAIGTGLTASPADAEEAHGIVRSAIGAAAGPVFADAAVVLYGGSVKPGNIGELMAASGVNGVLVGGASLDPESFAAICGVALPAG